MSAQLPLGDGRVIFIFDDRFFSFITIVFGEIIGATAKADKIGIILEFSFFLEVNVFVPYLDFFGN